MVVPATWLWRLRHPVGRFLHRYLLRPLGVAVAWVWRYTVVALFRGLVAIGRLGYRYLLRPVGLAVAWAWRHTAVPLFRGVVFLLRVTVVAPARWTYRAVLAPAGRWLRDDILRPIGAAVREVRTALGVRRG
ncbi:hypothetical protein ACFQ0D_23935 [Micromonospora zhanjiangensis]